MGGYSQARRLVVSLLLSALVCQAQAAEHSLDDDNLFHFVTRPDIRASRWNITTFHKDQIAPGYWFLAPYEFLDEPPNYGDPGWIGPHIYDNNGDLVWSGASMFDNRNVEDFRLSHIRGEDLMTLVSQLDGTGVIMDDAYRILKERKIDRDAKVNTHEFNFVDNGTRVLVVINDDRYAPLDQSREVGYHGRCFANFQHFRELDTETWETVFDWDTRDHVRLSESTMTDGSLGERCARWDFFHSNSIDKTPSGDYLYSSRHTDTIYKVSGKDGHIIWRLGGKLSDFGHGDWTFSRQHDIRFRHQNATHMVVTLLDNARGIDSRKPTYGFSRGLVLALDEEAMKVDILLQIDHPDGEGNYAPRRGNYQTLPGGNIFLGWSEVAIQSEHAPDGTILMHARLMADWLGSYRNYKFNFTGRPTEKPAVHSVAYTTDSGSNATVAYVSWNGATDVESWNLYKTTKDDDIRVLVASSKRTGFETAVRHDGLAKFVLLEAVDSKGETLGTSKVIETKMSTNVTDAARVAESGWIDSVGGKKRPLLGIPTFVYFLGVFSVMLIGLIIWALWYRGVRGVNIPRWFPTPARYEKLEENQEEEPLRMKHLEEDLEEDPGEAEPLRPKGRNSNDLDML